MQLDMMTVVGNYFVNFMNKEKTIVIITPYEYWWGKHSANVVADIYKKKGIVPIVQMTRNIIELKD